LTDSDSTVKQNLIYPSLFPGCPRTHQVSRPVDGQINGTASTLRILIQEISRRPSANHLANLLSRNFARGRTFITGDERSTHWDNSQGHICPSPSMGVNSESISNEIDESGMQFEEHDEQRIWG
jgi:hypothetical protein